jgi:Na+-driven multidrug efflux pump
MPQSILTARGDTKILWYVSLGELAINVIASLVLMRYLGLIGIVWGTLIAYFFEKIVLMGILRDRYKIRFSEIINPLIWVMYGLLLVFTFMLSRWVFGI